jgi:outer membrane immunogenic protein
MRYLPEPAPNRIGPSGAENPALGARNPEARDAIRIDATSWRGGARSAFTFLPPFRPCDTKKLNHLRPERLQCARVVSHAPEAPLSGDFVMRFHFLLCAAALTVAASPALAADVVLTEPLAAPEVVAAEPGNDWNGFYLGALLGYSFGDSDIGDEAELDGIEGGAYAGAAWQYNNFVLGIEGDVLASGLESDLDSLQVEQGFNGSLRARAGIALDQFLLYGTAGAAMTELELDDGLGSDSQALLGWTAGAGAEAMITDNITARVEYRYSDYEDETFSLGGGDVDSDLSTHSIRAGVGLKF